MGLDPLRVGLEAPPLEAHQKFLRQADLLRNHLFMLLPTRADQVYEQVWRPMEQLIGVGNPCFFRVRTASGNHFDATFRSRYFLVARRSFRRGGSAAANSTR